MEEYVAVRIKKMYDDVRLPEYKNAGDAGMDVRAYLNDSVEIKKNEIKMIPTGISVLLPEGYEIQIRPRSGLSLKGISVKNSPGTIDQGFTGEIMIIVHNDGSKFDTFVVNDGDRVAQMVLQKVPKIKWMEVDILEKTERSDGGFGSTGID